jgi:hypothetical protein
MIQTPMSDQMIAAGQGEALEQMLKTYVPMARLGRPEEIADAVLWLCSSAASYVTGQSISVDGGFVMRRISHGDEHEQSRQRWSITRRDRCSTVYGNGRSFPPGPQRCHRGCSHRANPDDGNAVPFCSGARQRCEVEHNSVWNYLVWQSKRQ